MAAKRITLTKTHANSEFGTLLVQELQTISQDGRFTVDEIKRLDSLLQRGPLDIPSVEFLNRITQSILADDQLDENEAYELRLAVERVLPKNLREAVTQHLQGIQKPEPPETEEYEDIEPATQRQLDYIRDLGGNPHANIGKWEASDLIDQLRRAPSNRQMMVLRFWNRVDLARLGRDGVSEWMDQHYAEDGDHLEAWEEFKSDIRDRGEQSDPSIVPVGIGYDYLKRVKSRMPKFDFPDGNLFVPRSKFERRRNTVLSVILLLVIGALWACNNLSK